jgi:hypothetical protein
MLPSGTECNLRGSIVVLVRDGMKMETSKRTILLETSHEMRKEIAERDKKHEMSQVATSRKESKTGKKI